MADAFIVAGSDSLAVRLASELIALGEDVVVIARDMEPRFRVLLERDGVRVLEGDARDVADLHDAGLDDASALAIVEEDDVGNLHAALAAYSLRADLRLVVRIFNQHLGDRLEELFPQARILSASAIAAPAFLAAALRTSQRIVVADRSFEVRPLRDDDDPAGTLAVAAFDADAGTAALFPPAAPGVLALVPDDAAPDDDDGGGAFETAAEGVRQAASLASSLFTRAAAVGRLIDRRLVAVLALGALLIVAAAVVWSASTQYNVIDSAYFAVTTVSTTGYGDITPLHQSDALKFGVMALMLIGALVVALVYALVTDAIVGVRLARSLGERPRPRRDHVVVLGLGRIGQRVIEGLVARHIPCVAVERDEDAPGVHAARRLRVPVVLTDATRPGVLDALSLDRARCVMAVTNDDAANLEAALNVRALRPELRVVLRLFDYDLAQRVESAFSFHVSRSVSSLAAPAFTAALSGRRALATIPIGAQAVTVAELVAPAGRTVAELERAAEGEARVIAIGRRWNPPPHETVGGEEPIVAVGSPAGLAALTRS